MRLLHNEAEKLAAGAGYATVTEKVVNALATRNLDADVFALGDAILAHNGKKAFSVLETLLDGGASEYMVVGVLAGFYIDIYRIKCAMEQGIDDKKTMELFKYGKNGGYRLSRVQGRAKRLSHAALEGAVGVLSALDKDLRSSPVEERVLLENAVTRLLAL